MSWALLQNSLLVSGGATLAAVLFGLTAALWATALPRNWQHWLVGAAVVSFALPPFLVTNCWLHLLGEAGSWRAWLPLSIYSRVGATWILALMLWPISFLAAWSAWRRIEAAQLESDLLLSGFWLLRWLLWPMARPLMGVAMGLTFVLAFNNFAVPAILQVKVFPAELWLRYSTQFDYKAVLWLSVPVVAAPAVLLWLWPKQVTRWSLQGGRASPLLLRRQIGKSAFLSAGVLSVLVLCFSLGVPLGQLLGSSHTWSELPTVFKAEPRLFFQSGLLAAAAAFACSVVGIVSSKKRWGMALWLPLLAPGVVLGVGLVFLLNRPVLEGVYHSLAVVVLSWALRYSGLAWNGFGRTMRGVDPDLVDDARLNGAKGWVLFRLAYLPQIAAGAGTIWYVTYLLCLWDVETIVLTYPPGGETLALRIFNLLHYGHTAQVNALCLLLLLLAVAPLVFWLGSRGWSWRWPRALPLLLAGLFGGCAEPTTPHQIFSNVEVIGSRGTRMGEFNKPRSLALDKNDNLYVVDMTGRVQKFSPEGKFLLSWQMPETDLGKPKGMGCDGAGNILVVEPHYQRVNHFSPEGKLLAQWGSKGTNAGFLTLPRSIVVNAAGNIYLSEYTTVDRVQCFSRDGRQFLFSFGRPGSGEGEFNRAEGLATDSSNRVYVADSCNHRIEIFSADGKFLRTYGSPGSGLGQLSYPYDIRVDAQGYQYVCEFGNSRIQVFDAQDRPVEIVGGIGSGPGKLNNPWAIALDSKGNLYVADANNHRVQKFIRAKHGT